MRLHGDGGGLDDLALVEDLCYIHCEVRDSERGTYTTLQDQSRRNQEHATARIKRLARS